MIPRPIETQKLLDNQRKRQPTLLCGEIGMGKTVLLRQVAQQIEKAIFIEGVFPFKSTLLLILFSLHRNGDLHLPGVPMTQYLPWEELLKKLSRQTNAALLELVTANLNGKGYTLLLDALETATPSLEKGLLALMEHATVIGATRRKKPGLVRLWWRFETVELRPLSRNESQTLLWSVLDRDSIKDPALLERTVLNQANGNPLVIVQLAERAKREEALTPDGIRSLWHEAGQRFLDITPLFFLLGTVAIAARFFALGINSTDLYILAGVTGGVLMGLRFFLYRSMRGKE